MNMRGGIVVGGLVLLAVFWIWFGSSLFTPEVPDPRPRERPRIGEPPPPAPAPVLVGDPARENAKPLGEIDLAAYLPPESERGGLDPGTRTALELLAGWCSQAKGAKWPSVVLVLADERPSAQQRVLRVAFAKTLRVRITALVDEAPTIELAAEDGAHPLKLQLGEGMPPVPYADVTSAYRAFESVERLRRVQLVATREPLLDLIDLESSVARARRTDEAAPGPAGATFKVQLQSPTHVLTLQPRGSSFCIQRIAPGS
jgi:hypothetical protein